MIRYNQIKESDSIPKGSTLLLKNTEKAPQLGARYGQDVEPSGFYCLIYNEKFQKHLLNLPNYELYSFNIKNPLIVDITKDTIQWKKDLALEYSAKGKALTKKLLQKGYDIIIAYDSKYKETGEIIVLDTKKLKKEE